MATVLVSETNPIHTFSDFNPTVNNDGSVIKFNML